MSKEPDIGLQLLQGLTEWATSKNIAVVPGWLTGQEAFVRIELASEEDQAGQLGAILDRLAVDFLVINHDVFEAEDLKDTLDELMERGAPADEIDTAKACRKYLGQVSLMRARVFLKSGALLGYDYSSEWYNDAYGEGEGDVEDLEQDEEYRAQIAEREKWGHVTRSEAARRIASDSRFPQAKTEAARVLITRDLLGTDCPENEYLIKEISREAKAVFDLEIKPKKA